METKEIITEHDITIKIGGIPFGLPAGSVITGLQSNYELALEIVDQAAPRTGIGQE